MRRNSLSGMLQTLKTDLTSKRLDSQVGNLLKGFNIQPGDRIDWVNLAVGRCGLWLHEHERAGNYYELHSLLTVDAREGRYTDDGYVILGDGKVISAMRHEKTVGMDLGILQEDFELQLQTGFNIPDNTQRRAIVKILEYGLMDTA